MTTRKTTRSPAGGTGIDYRTAGTLGHLDIAQMLGISRARVSQIEYRALAKMKVAIEREASRAGVSVYEWLYG